jgi:hypothetical protein
MKITVVGAVLIMVAVAVVVLVALALDNKHARGEKPGNE